MRLSQRKGSVFVTSTKELFFLRRLPGYRLDYRSSIRRKALGIYFSLKALCSWERLQELEYDLLRVFGAEFPHALMRMSSRRGV